MAGTFPPKGIPKDGLWVAAIFILPHICAIPCAVVFLVLQYPKQLF
jgi:hypothetical protein